MKAVRKFFKNLHWGPYLVKHLIRDIQRETDPVERSRLELLLKKFETTEEHTHYYLKVKFTCSDHMEDLIAINYLAAQYPKEAGVLEGRLYVSDSLYHSLHPRLQQHFVRDTIRIPSYRYEAGVYH